MTRIVAKETGPAAKRARRRMRRKGGGGSSGVELLEQSSSKGSESRTRTDSSIDSQQPFNNSSTPVVSESDSKNSGPATPHEEPRTLPNPEDPAADAEPKSTNKAGQGLQTETLQGTQPESQPPSEPMTPQILPTSNLSTPGTQTPLSRHSSVRALPSQSPREWPSEESTTPTSTPKGRRLWHSPFTTLMGWRGKDTREPIDPTSTPKNASKSPQPKIDFKRVRKCGTYRLPAPVQGQCKHPCGMDTSESRAEKQKRRGQEAEASARTSKETDSGVEITEADMGEESLRQRNLRHEVPNALTERENQAVGKNDEQDPDTRRETSEWTVV